MYCYFKIGATRIKLQLNIEIVPDSHLSHLLVSSIPLKPLERAKILEHDEILEKEYDKVARKGSSAVPEDPTAEVDYHYVCFVKSGKNGHLYELDGDKRGPIDRGLVASDQDMLDEECLKVVKEYLDTNKELTGFSLMALAPSE